MIEILPYINKRGEPVFDVSDNGLSVLVAASANGVRDYIYGLHDAMERENAEFDASGMQLRVLRRLQESSDRESREPFWFYRALITQQ